VADQGKISKSLTQAQVDAQTIYAAAASIDPYQAALIKKNAQGNIMSPGVLQSLSALGVDAKSSVASSIADIDAATRETRLADQKKVSQDRQKEEFEKTLRGTFWRGVKGAVRGATVVFSAIPQYVDATYRTTRKEIQERGVAGGLVSGLGLSFEDGGDQSAKIAQQGLDQTYFGQVTNSIIDGIKKKKFPKFELGSGFFPSEETGLGHASRQASLSAAKIAIRNDDGELVGYRPRTFFGDQAANIFTLGNPETVAGTNIALVADIVGSFALDPGIAKGQQIRELKKIAAQERAGNAFKDAAKTEAQIKLLEKAQDEALVEANAIRIAAARLKDTEVAAAKADLGLGLSKIERQAAATAAIKASQSVRIAQSRLDEFTAIETKELEALTSAKEARLAIEAAAKAPKQIERAEKALQKQRKQLDEMTSARESAVSRGLVPSVSDDDIYSLADAIRVTEQNIANTKSLIESSVGGEDLVRRLNPNMQNTIRVEALDINFVQKFKEYDRAGVNAYPGWSAEKIAEITEDLKSGKGFTDPLLLTYWVSAAGELSLRLVEGNHRILAAIEAGLDSVPIRLQRGDPARINEGFETGLISKILPDESGYTPATPAASEVLPENILKQAQVMPNDAITPEALTTAKELEKKAAQRLSEIKAEREYVAKQVAERTRTEALINKARQGVAKNTLKAAKENATLSDRLNDATLSLKDKRKSWELAVERIANIEKTAERPEFAYKNIAEFLTNGHGTRAVDRLVEMTDWKEIWRKADGKINHETAKAIAAATTPDELVDVIAPYLLKGDIEAGALTPGRLSRMGESISARTAFAMPGVRKLQGVGARVQSRLAEHEKTATLFAQFNGFAGRVGSSLKRSYTTKVKSGSIINIHDREELLRGVEDFGRAAKLPMPVLDKLIDEIADASSNATAGFAASTKLLDAVFARFSETVPKNMQDSFAEYTTAFKDSNEKMSSYWATRHAQGANLEYMTLRGDKVLLPGPHLSSELLNSTIYLPPVSELLKMTSSLAKIKPLAKGTEIGDALIGKYWKTIQLVRPAYIIRNIAEEQIRVAAVGHASFFSRPGQALAMWLGREDGPWYRRTLNQFDTYKNTVFDEAFSTGDDALDILDETLGQGMKNSYVNMMNSAKSGNFDERNFRVLQFKNVAPVAFGHTRFFDGVTNQIRMLNSDELARVVAGHNPKFIADAVANGQFRQEAVIDYFLTGPGRRQLDIFADSTPDKFKAFIRTPDGLKAYLFTGKNEKGVDISMLARINETTGGNKSLQEMIATGKTDVGGLKLSIPRASNDAVNSISNSKQMKAGKKSLLEEQDKLAKQIKEMFSDAGNWDNVQVNVPSKNVTNAESSFDRNGFVEWFFDKSTELEKNSTFGPEFRQAYWDAINTVAKALDSNAKAQLLRVAQDSLTPLQKFGRAPLSTGRVIKAQDEVISILNSQRAKGFTIDNFKQFEESIVNYTNGSGNYSLVNTFLRGDKSGFFASEISKAEKITSDLDSLIAKAPKLEESITTYRGIADKNLAEQLLKLKPGESFSDTAFVSTSLREDIAENFARFNGWEGKQGKSGVVVEIVNPAGTKGIFPLGFRTEVDSTLAGRANSEQEFLLPRDTKFYVTEVKGNRIKVTLDNNADFNIGTKHPVWNAFKAADGNGPLDLEAAHAYADAYARKHVRDLFYNAHEKRLIFHQLRLIAPFGAAWENTISKWAELGTENPVGVYKALKIFDWAQRPESSSIYLMTDAEEYYDPNQGFFFTEPNSGQRQFFVPFAGTIMASLAKNITGAKYDGAPLAFSANPMSFNFAFGAGTFLPGIGPGITLPLSVLATFNGNFIDAMPLAVQKWLFPFGQANFTGGLQTAILPGNWNKIIGGITGMEQTYASNFRPVMNYLASGANYNLDDADDQARLVADTDTFARWESVMRGVIGLVSPMGLIQQGLGTDKDGDLTLQTTLYEDFQTIYQSNDGDYNKAWYDFLNLYGASQAFALIGSTKGEGPSNWDSYAFVVENPDVATKYKDVWGYIMPGGGLSTEMYQWNVVRDKKKSLNPTEILQKVNNQRFYAAKDALLTRVDAGEFNRTQYSDALTTLKEVMGGGPVVEFDVNKRDRIIGQLNGLVEDNRFAEIQSIAGLRDYMAIRGGILGQIGKSKFTGAQSEQTARDYLAAQAEWVVKKYPDFQKMFYAFFANELEGK
jgi:hypothetical protein